MAQQNWQIQGKTATHTVCLEHAYVSGKATITLDGEFVYHRPRKWVDFGLKHRVVVGGLDCLVRITPMPWCTFWYRFYIDGKRSENAE